MTGMRRVAVMIDLDWPVAHHHQMVAGIQRYARECGRWDCSINPHADLLLTGRGGEAGLDGVVARATLRLAELARKAGVPVVNVWLNTPAEGLPSVLHDAEESGRMAARHLMARGFRTFAYLGYARDKLSRLQVAGFRAVLSEKGCPCSECWLGLRYALTGVHWQQFQAKVGRWIDGWSPPIGVFVAHDLLCRYLAEACRQRGLEVPFDVALVGSHNEAVVCAFSAPALSSIDFGFERIGYRAAALLDRLMDGSPPPAKPILLVPAELVARQSSDAFAVNDPAVAKALRFIAEHGHEAIGVQDVAAHVPTTRRTLSRLFQKSLSRTVYEAIIHLRLERAKRRLVESGVALKRIATECGFRDSIHLCKVFRREEGTSPSEYRAARMAPRPVLIGPHATTAATASRTGRHGARPR